MSCVRSASLPPLVSVAVCPVRTGAYPGYKLRPFFIPLFTLVRGSRILRSPLAGSCIVLMLGGRKRLVDQSYE